MEREVRTENCQYDSFIVSETEPKADTCMEL